MYHPLDRSKPCPFPILPTQTYLGESPDGYYVMEGFFDNLGNMFKRMVKFTPKSFTPGNIWQGVRNTTLTTMTGGIYLALPRSVKKTMEKAANIAIPVVAGAVAAYTLGPSIMSAIGPKLGMVASALGKNISSVGGTLFGLLGKLPASKQAQIAQAVTPEEILYSERYPGQFPPRIMNMIDEAERATYFPAVNAAYNPNPYAMPNYEDQYGSDGMQAQGPMPDLAQQDQGWSSGGVLGVVGVAVVAAVLISRK